MAKAGFFAVSSRMTFAARARTSSPYGAYATICVHRSSNEPSSGVSMRTVLSITRARLFSTSSRRLASILENVVVGAKPPSAVFRGASSPRAFFSAARVCFASKGMPAPHAKTRSPPATTANVDAPHAKTLSHDRPNMGWRAARSSFQRGSDFASSAETRGTNSVGSRLSVTETPSPHCPRSFAPHTNTRPSAVRATACAEPHDTCVTRACIRAETRPGTSAPPRRRRGERGEGDEGDEDVSPDASSALSRPSCPRSFAPNVYTRPAAVSTAECASPPTAATTGYFFGRDGAKPSATRRAASLSAGASRRSPSRASRRSAAVSSCSAVGCANARFASARGMNRAFAPRSGPSKRSCSSNTREGDA